MDGGHPILLMGSTPIQDQEGVTHPRSEQGVPHPADGEYPHPRSGWEGYPGVLLSTTGWGTPLSKTGWSTHHPKLDGVPPLQDWMGYPPDPRLDGGTPLHPRLDRVPPSKTEWGTIPSKTGWGIAHLRLDGVSPIQDWMGCQLPPSAK